jgi:hypothetical protein
MPLNPNKIFPSDVERNEHTLIYALYIKNFLAKFP